MTHGDTSDLTADNAISRLIGLEWTGLGRTADLVWCTFGKVIKWSNHKGEFVDKSEYSLHMQCPFRVSFQGKIKLGSSDIYLHAENQDSDSTELPEMYAAFDAKAAELTSGIGLSKAESADVSGFGDISIRFSNGVILEAFAVASDNYESWRILGFREPGFCFAFPDDTEFS